MRATVKDVARLAGVSPKTVSNVVTGKVPVSEQTRAKVESALAELDYVPNLAARGLRTGRTGVVALALPDLTTAYSADLLHHFVVAATARGWTVQVEETGTASARREAELISRAREHHIDGLILNPVLLETTAVQRGATLPPLVLIGEVDQPIADHVWVDNVAAARAMTAHLIERGGPRVAALGRMHSATSRLRIKGYRAALKAAGAARASTLEIECAEWTAHGGYEALRAWLRRQPAPDALFCLTDTLALGALRALAEAGLSVPGTVVVGGYDDVPDSAMYSPPLTTIGVDKTLFAEAALDLLDARIADAERPITSRTLEHRLIERDSTRR